MMHRKLLSPIGKYYVISAVQSARSEHVTHFRTRNIEYINLKYENLIFAVWGGWTIIESYKLIDFI